MHHRPICHLIDEQEFTMPGLARIAPFVHTAERRSFRLAAAHLGVTPTAVSKAVGLLEEELGVRLLNRTSRHVSLTPEGEVYLRHCREALDRLQSGHDLVTRAAKLAQGTLRVSASPVFARALVGALDRLLGRHSRLQLHLSFSDRTLDLAEHGIDLVLRIGGATDSALVGRRLRTPRWVTVASPNYLARAGEPRSIEDLGAHRCLQFARPSGKVAAWQFRTGELVANAPVLLDNGDALVDGAVAGIGIAQVFDFMVKEPIRRGELRTVLDELACDGPPVHALCLPARRRVPKIRAFMDFAVDVLGTA
jgi:DNA-binding transcriptional LysR family regulator